jgi:hypothetical protein
MKKIFLFLFIFTSLASESQVSDNVFGLRKLIIRTGRPSTSEWQITDSSGNDLFHVVKLGAGFGVPPIFPSYNTAGLPSASTYTAGIAYNTDSSKITWSNGSSWQYLGGGGGVNTIGALNGGTYSANGASITGVNLYLQGVNESHPGLVTTGTDSMAGAKLFTGIITINGTAHSGNQFFVKGGNSYFECNNGGTAYGDIATSSFPSGHLGIFFQRITSTGPDDINFESGDIITDNSATGEMRFYNQQSGGGFQTWYTQSTERMRLTYLGNLSVNSTSDNSKLFVSGSFATAVNAFTGNHTATISDYTMEFTSGVDTCTLPTAVGIKGRMYSIVNAGTSVFINTTSSQTFVNVTATPTTLLLSAIGATTVQSDGANWMKLNDIYWWVLLAIAPAVFMKKRRQKMTII